MTDEKMVWCIVDTNGNILPSAHVYTEGEIRAYVQQYQLIGYRVVQVLTSPVHAYVMEPIVTDSERKTKIVHRVENLSDRERALLLAFLSKRIRQVQFETIHAFPRIRIIYEEIHNIFWGTQHFKEMLIATLRQTA